MKSPLCQLADVAIALHARENRSTISPPPLTAISTQTTGTAVTSVRSESSLTPQHIRARRYGICIERERPAVDITGALMTRQKQFQNYYQPPQPTTQNATVRALPPLRYHYNPITFRQQTAAFRTNLRRAAVAQTATTSNTMNVDMPPANKKAKIEDKSNKINKSLIKQEKSIEDEQKELQLKIKTVEQLQQEENLELLIKASEQHEKHLEKEEVNIEKQQMVKAEEMEKNLNVIDLTDSDEDTLTGTATSQTTTQCNHRKRKRHHRRHRRRQTQKSVLLAAAVKEKKIKLQEEQEK